MTFFRHCLILGFMLIGQLAGPDLCCPWVTTEPLAPPVELQGGLPKIIKTETGNRQLFCRGEAICTAQLMPLFYERRGFRPGWSREGRVSPQTRELVVILANVAAEGLHPDDYHLHGISFLLNKLNQLQVEGKLLTPAELVDLDLLLTDAFFLYGSHLRNGRTNHEAIYDLWDIDDYPPDLAVILDEALSSYGVATALHRLRPSHAGYRMMMAALVRLRNIADRGGWPMVGPGQKLKKGTRHSRVHALRQRLMISGDYDVSGLAGEEFFDEKLAAAVRLFQRRHGLEVDGIVGPETLAALNVPVESRVQQIEANLERCRWLPHNLGRSYIMVNIADFSLKVVENSQEVMAMRVVVGKPLRRTPIFSDRVEYLVINPFWYLPETIIIEDVVPNILKSPDYLTRKMIKVFAAGGEEKQEIDPGAINWAGISRDNLPYKLRQEPGALNALGRVKIMFPNKFSIYLHDTPSRELFRQSVRDFSSGCIRVEKPVELVAYLLKNDRLWSREKVLASMASGKRQVVSLPEHMPIHIVYRTAWGDEDGKIHFRKDIYERDKLLALSLDRMGKQPSQRLPEAHPAGVHMDEI
jgi:murein L,D-transpeptidase YcbB/YkuD